MVKVELQGGPEALAPEERLRHLREEERERKQRLEEELAKKKRELEELEAAKKREEEAARSAEEAVEEELREEEAREEEEEREGARREGGGGESGGEESSRTLEETLEGVAPAGRARTYESGGGPPAFYRAANAAAATINYLLGRTDLSEERRAYHEQYLQRSIEEMMEQARENNQLEESYTFNKVREGVLQLQEEHPGDGYVNVISNFFKPLGQIVDYHEEERRRRSRAAKKE